MTDSPPDNSVSMSKSRDNRKTFIRFDLSQRAEHLALLITFATLGLTGLAQRYATSNLGELIIGVLGGIETTRIIHRLAAFFLMLESIYHIISVLYRIFVQRAKLSMLPVLEDFKHLIHDVLYYFGRRKRKADYGRYSYAEKAEYFAVVWGTILMGITGYMMWNPVATARWLPGEYIPAAKAAHGGEAVLAVLAIILWHFYQVHMSHLNLSMFSGRLSRKEMEREHPAELRLRESEDPPKMPSKVDINKREQIFLPIAALLTIGLGFSVYKFVTFEETAIKTIPPGESVVAFVPYTPTPAPTLPPTPTPSTISDLSWDGAFEGLFRDRCSTCHGFTSVGGLSLASYEDILIGGDSGPGIIARDPDNSVLVQVQLIGNHPGQLTISEMESVIEWILIGAPER